MMRSVTITKRGDLEIIRDEWERLVERDPRSTLFQAPAWVLPWWTFFGAGYGLNVIAVYEGDDLAGLAPLMTAGTPDQSTLWFLGEPLNDQNRVLAVPSHRRAVGQAIIESLHEENPRWCQLALSQVRGPFDALGITEEDVPARWNISKISDEPSVHLRLPNSWDDFLADLPRDRRKNLEYRVRRLWKDLAPIPSVVSDQAFVSNLIIFFEELRVTSWRQRGRFENLAPLLSSDSYSKFISATAVEFARRGQFQFTQLVVDEVQLAASLMFMNGNTIFCYSKAFNPAFSRYSPGIVLDWFSVKNAIEQGWKVLDYGRGIEQYKFLMGGEQYNLANWVLSSTTIC